MTDFKINAYFLPGTNNIRVVDDSNWDVDERAKYRFILFYFNGIVENIASYTCDISLVNNKTKSIEWLIPGDRSHTFDIKVFAVPVFDASKLAPDNNQAYPGTYPKKQLVCIDNGSNVVLWKGHSTSLAPTAAPGEDSQWDELLQSNAGTLMINMFSATGKYFTTTIVYPEVPSFSLKKYANNTYKYTASSLTSVSPFNSPVNKVSLYNFNDYINGKTALSTVDVEQNSVTDITVPGDGIYIVTIEISGGIYWIPVYCFDSLREVMKDVLKKIFNPPSCMWCFSEQERQLREHRAFITRVTTAFHTMMGMIHAEYIDHYTYFSWDESRLAALQRANDILQLTLLLAEEYKSELLSNTEESC